MPVVGLVASSSHFLFILLASGKVFTVTLPSAFLPELIEHSNPEFDLGPSPLRKVCYSCEFFISPVYYWCIDPSQISSGRWQSQGCSNHECSSFCIGFSFLSHFSYWSCPLTSAGSICAHRYSSTVYFFNVPSTPLSANVGSSWLDRTLKIQQSLVDEIKFYGVFDMIKRALTTTSATEWLQRKV